MLTLSYPTPRTLFSRVAAAMIVADYTAADDSGDGCVYSVVEVGNDLGIVAVAVHENGTLIGYLGN